MRKIGQDPDKLAKKKTKTVRPLHEFEIRDIIGEFEIDDQGNFLILRGDAGETMDKQGRLVNKRGYLIDREGNVVNHNGEMVFRASDLDQNQEIPAPYSFEKRKQNLMNIGSDS